VNRIRIELRKPSQPRPGSEWILLLDRDPGKEKNVAGKQAKPVKNPDKSYRKQWCLVNLAAPPLRAA
jgi:hypothetical protein